ncbi:uncharacterized protein [Clytia hemisphaerica]|uniref:Uncharacterized protein n=1 Tax=Clytia hemisphaerica TaxID=252671 RepID=A0A7M5WVB5_9CNID
MAQSLPSNPAGDKYDHQWEALAGWFLGPRAENRNIFNDLMLKALNWHEDRREEFFPADPSYFTEEIKNSEAAQHEYKDMEKQMKEMHRELNKSIPFFSTRYQGHMTWDITMPSFLGYVSGLLWNQNNVDSTASPVTTKFEVEVGQQLCKLMRFDDTKVTPWGHLTGCGSVANIESMWAARNTKLHPLALKDACADPHFPELIDGLECKVFVPGQQKEKTLKECTEWELLNLRIDDICSLTDDVIKCIEQRNPDFKVDVKATVDKALEKNSPVQLGLPEFYRRHKIGEPSDKDATVRTYPLVFSPGTNHYSWPKASTILGIGDSNNIHIQVDSKARQDIETLEKELDYALEHKIAVFMVVAVIGSTEESAVDDIARILALKPKYEAKGLTFSVHADAAWGGYLNCMTHETGDKESNVYSNCLPTKAHDFVPAIPLSDFVKKQYVSLQFADTVTIDPHKSGFCPYPAGALLYRNGTMKGFITLAAPEVFHSPDDLNVGIYGLEGSKPGAAACGVLLSHRVIGLDQNGYGRILGQCQLGAKLFYCMWETVARDDDPFICCNFIPLDLKELQEKGFSFKTQQDVHDYIKKHIIDKPNEQLVKNVHKEIDFLGIVGPDALINSFTVNCKDQSTGKGQQNIELVNDLQNLIFNELTSSVGEDTKRVKMFLTTSKLEYSNYGKSVQQLKERLNLPTENTHDALGFLRNTCMEPYQASEAYVEVLGDLFRKTVLTCIGALDTSYGEEYGDALDYHTFTVVNNLRKDGKIFLDFVPTFTKKQSQYQAVFRVKILPEDQETFREIQSKATEPLFMRTTEKFNLFHFVKNNLDATRTMALYQGAKTSNTCLASIGLHIDEVWRMERFESPQYAEYNKLQKYFLYGDEEEAFMSHVVTKQPDFYQVVRLGELPHSVEPQLLNLGLTVVLPAIPGTPLTVDGKIIDPLQTSQYGGKYRGRQFVECTTSLLVSGENCKVYFDSEYLNTTVTGTDCALV